MVFFFSSTVCKPPATIYMGRDKFENEEMLKYGNETDIWFHVDDLSSAHVYLQLQDGWTLDTIPESVLVDCCQLVKNNSIEGNKKSNVRIVYTPFTNLKKLPSHEVGQISFHSEKALKYITVEKRINEIINRLNKTKEERQIDWAADKERRMQVEKARNRALFEAKRAQSEKEAKEWQAQKAATSYENVMKPEKMSSNKFDHPMNARDYEDNFF